MHGVQRRLETGVEWGRLIQQWRSAASSPNVDRLHKVIYGLMEAMQMKLNLHFPVKLQKKTLKNSTWIFMKFHMNLHEIPHESSWNSTWIFMKFHLKIHEIPYESSWNSTWIFMKFHMNLHEIPHESSWNSTRIFMKFHMNLLEIPHEIFMKFHMNLHEIPQWKFMATFLLRTFKFNVCEGQFKIMWVGGWVKENIVEWSGKVSKWAHEHIGWWVSK